MNTSAKVGICTLAIACLAMAACRDAAHQREVVITQATFGVYRTQEAGQVALQPTDIVPHMAGQQYGWLIRLKTDRSRVRWREELHLPDAPATWGSERIGRRSLSADKRTLVTEREVETRSGYIFNAWQVEPGDPVGRYTLQVTVENGPSARFAFTVK
ncbi:hypothetical protein [Lysobacter terrae]